MAGPERRTLAFNQFDGGMTSDPRNSVVNTSRVCKHFDSFTYPHKLSPQKSSEAGDGNSTTDMIANFQYVGGTLYGLGVVSGSAKAEVFSKTDFTNSAWGTPANNASSAGARDTNVFVYYHGLIYGLRAGNEVYSFAVNGSGWTDSVTTLNYTNTAPGLVHSKDDVLYIPTDNFINSYNIGTTTWATNGGAGAALTLPANLIITNICEYGNYLAIGCKDSNSGRSRVYLWDRNSSLTTLSESIDWGAGQLTVLEQLEGYLIGVSLETSVFGSAGKDRLVFRYYNGATGAKKFTELVSDNGGVNQLAQCKQVQNNRIYFMAMFHINGVQHEGVWSIGRDTLTGPFAINIDRKPNNDTPTTGVTGVMENFIIIADCMFISYIDNGNWEMSKTDDQPNYTATSYYETIINPQQPEMYRATAGTRSNVKQLMGAALGTEPLPSGAVATLNYRVDGGSWITIISATTTGAIVTECGFTDVNGTAITSGREYEFQILSTGGAEITEVKYQIDINETLL